MHVWTIRMLYETVLYVYMQLGGRGYSPRIGRFSTRYGF
jgi:hypothetical protein